MILPCTLIFPLLSCACRVVGKVRVIIIYIRYIRLFLIIFPCYGKMRSRSFWKRKCKNTQKYAIGSLLLWCFNKNSRFCTVFFSVQLKIFFFLWRNNLCQQPRRWICSKNVCFFTFCKFLKINGVLKKFKNSSIFSLEMFCQFKNLPYLCTRFRQATRQRADERTATIDPWQHSITDKQYNLA